MRNKFPGYYKLSDADFNLLWNNGLFIFDTNVLLDLYRYSDETVESLFEIMESIKERIWIPFQVSKEYHKNLSSIIAEQVRKYDTSINTLSDFKKQIEEKRSHPFLEEGFKDEIDKFCSKFDEILKAKKKNIRELIISNPTKERLADLLENKIGDALSPDELKAIFVEGEKRYTENTPPGYLDKKKPAPDKYGDLVIWKEILKKNIEIDQPIIFITRDTKDDWFMNEMGLTISPRPELIEEFKKTKPNLFYCYSTTSFLQYANEYLNADVDKSSIDEIEEFLKNLQIDDIDDASFYQIVDDDFILPNESDSIDSAQSEDSDSDSEDSTGEIKE